MRLLIAAALVLLASGCYKPPPAQPVHSPKSAAVAACEAAQAALQTGKTDEALEHAAAAHEADPAYAQAAWLYASLLGRVGRYDDALAVCTTLCAASPNFVQAHLLEGILWERNGERESANRAYGRVLAQLETAEANQAALPAYGLYGAVAAYLRDGKLAGVKAINSVLLQFPDYGPAQYMKTCMQDKDRTFILRWFSEKREENTESPENLTKVQNHTTQGSDETESTSAGDDAS